MFGFSGIKISLGVSPLAASAQPAGSGLIHHSPRGEATTMQQAERRLDGRLESFWGAPITIATQPYWGGVTEAGGSVRVQAGNNEGGRGGNREALGDGWIEREG